MVAFVASVVILVVGIGICLLVGRARPPGTPLTWGEAFVGGTFVFALMVVAYGIVPNQWLKFADNELLWRSDKIFAGISSNGIKMGMAGQHVGGTGRLLINYQAIRDIVAALIYALGLGAQVVLWSVWQKRGRKKPEMELTSAFGRPVMRKV